MTKHVHERRLLVCGLPLAAFVVLLTSVQFSAAQLGVRFEWVEASDNSGLSFPRLPGLEVQAGEDDMKKEDDMMHGKYEKAWSAGGFDKFTKNEWFAGSQKVRRNRPASVTHRVGTVYVHTKTRAKGVVIGWDEKTVASRQWVDATDAYGGYDWQDRLARLLVPHYSVLEEVERPDGSIQYLQRYVVSMCRPRQAPPSCLEIQAPALELSHPDLDHYFRGFDASQGYLPNDRLSRLYPEG